MNASNLTNFNAIWKLTSPLDPRCGWAKQPKVYCDTGICSLESTTYPFLLCIATVGSLLNIIVFAKERPKVAKGVYLMVMASADCGYMILIAFTIDRFLAIKSPLHHRLINSPRKAWTIAGCIVVIAGVSSINRLVDYYWFLANDPGFGPLPVRPVALRRWRMLNAWFLVVEPIATFLIVLVLNFSLGRILICRKRKREPLRPQLSHQSHNYKPNCKISTEQNAMILLTACVLLYLISQLPAVVLNIFEIFDMACFKQKSRTYEGHFNSVKFFCLYLNYSLNFVLYCAVSPTFRMQLINALRKCYVHHFAVHSRQASYCHPSHHSVKSWFTFPSFRRAPSSGHPQERDESSSFKERSFLIK